MKTILETFPEKAKEVIEAISNVGTVTVIEPVDDRPKEAADEWSVFEPEPIE